MTTVDWKKAPKWASSVGELDLGDEGRFKVYYGRPPYMGPSTWYLVNEASRTPARALTEQEIEKVTRVVSMRESAIGSNGVYELTGISITTQLQDETATNLYGPGKLSIYNDGTASYETREASDAESSALTELSGAYQRGYENGRRAAQSNGVKVDWHPFAIRKGDEEKVLQELKRIGAEFHSTAHHYGETMAAAFENSSSKISVATVHDVDQSDVQYTLDVDGYQSLASILVAAYEQASVGKGKDRHANELPFDKQPMQRVSDLLNSENGMAFQAVKKIQEGLRMEPGARKRELLGAIVYLAGMIIWLENNRCASPTIPQS